MERIIKVPTILIIIRVGYYSSPSSQICWWGNISSTIVLMTKSLVLSLLGHPAPSSHLACFCQSPFVSYSLQFFVVCSPLAGSWSPLVVVGVGGKVLLISCGPHQSTTDRNQESRKSHTIHSERRKGDFSPWPQIIDKQQQKIWRNQTHHPQNYPPGLGQGEWEVNKMDSVFSFSQFVCVCVVLFMKLNTEIPGISPKQKNH